MRLKIGVDTGQKIELDLTLFIGYNRQVFLVNDKKLVWIQKLGKF